MAAKRDGGLERRSSRTGESPQHATPKGVDRYIAGFLQSILVANGGSQNFLQRNAATIAVAAILLVMASGVAGWVLYERSGAVEEGLRTAGNLAHVLEEQVARTFQSVDLTMRGTIDILRLAPPGVVDDAELIATLRRDLANMPFVRSFCIIDADGFIRIDTASARPVVINLADRDYFRAHIENNTENMHIGPPLASRSTGQPFIGMSRRITLADGSFGGIVMALVEPLYFTRFYEALRLSPTDSIGLFLRDGTILTRTPDYEHMVGQSFLHSPLFTQRLPRVSRGTYRGVSVFDSERRILSYRTLNDYPVVVAYGISERALLASWRNSAIGAGVATLLAASLLLGMFLLVRRYRTEYEVARDRSMRASNLETVGHMAGGIAHDFRNFLAVISSSIRIMRRSTDDPEQLEKSACIAEDAVRQGAALTSQLTSLAHGQALDLKPANVNEAITEILPLLRQAAGVFVSVELRLAENLPDCILDRAQFSSALLNLAVNARDAMPKGGVLRVATASVSAGETMDDLENGHVRVSLTDTGHGMSPEVLQRSTEPFFTTKLESGTGLGLAQVHMFMRTLGGDLSIVSEPGRGTAIHLLIPRAGSDALPSHGRYNGTHASVLHCQAR